MGSAGSTPDAYLHSAVDTGRLHDLSALAAIRRVLAAEPVMRPATEQGRRPGVSRDRISIAPASPRFTELSTRSTVEGGGIVLCYRSFLDEAVLADVFYDILDGSVSDDD